MIMKRYVHISEIMTDRPTNQQTDTWVHREVTLPIIASVLLLCIKYICLSKSFFSLCIFKVSIFCWSCIVFNGMMLNLYQQIVVATLIHIIINSQSGSSELEYQLWKRTFLYLIRHTFTLTGIKSLRRVKHLIRLRCPSAR